MKQFRETLWFKKGELDAMPELGPDGLPSDELRPGDVLMPIEDRYLDDDSVTRDDSSRYGVRTGSTSYLPLVDEPATHGGDDTLGALVGEMKRGRRGVFALIGGGIAMACAVLVLYAF